MMSAFARRLALGVSTTVILASLAVAPVAAETLVREHYEGSESGEWSDCGYTYEFEGRWSGVFSLKSGHAGDPTPYLTDNYSWDWINRNPENGKWFTEHGNGQYKDLKITNLGGTVYRFVAQESGSPFTIVTSDGEKISMDRGLLRVTFVVDTLGDADIENDIHDDASFELIADRGAHPQWHRTLEDYCEVVNSLLQ
jgi:hypothetical protein